jgi:AmmeMemoRadiSam system radical SAM enzyme
MSNLSDELDRLTITGELHETLPDGAVRCYACGHRCLIREGRRGICQVRFNQGGELRVPWGYVAALQADPIEKKPFFHLLPGSDALTFGMLGCDFHCSYCFPGDTVVITDQGPLTLVDAFDSVQNVEQRSDAEIAHPESLKVFTRSGTPRKVRSIFKHPYRGQLTIVRPYYLPELSCTPDHRVFATLDVQEQPKLIQAKDLSNRHYLAIPRHYSFSSPQTIDVAKTLAGHQVTYRVRWDLSIEEREAVAIATHNGATSRQIGMQLSKDPSYIRHVRSKLAKGMAGDTRTNSYKLEAGTLRFPNEHKPGIPVRIPLDEGMARLLGYYCAEGSITQSKNRPNSLSLNFSLSLAEAGLAEDIQQLLREYLHVEAHLVYRDTTMAVSVTKASAALLFKMLAGGRSREKRVPQLLFAAPRHVAQAFLDAYVARDGHRYENGKTNITTVSHALAYGIALLCLKLGYFPSLYRTTMAEKATVQGRLVNRAPNQYSVVWYKEQSIDRKVVETKDFYLVPLKEITSSEYDGFVYNMEVEEEHNYLAGFFLVSNCQNWLTSQAMRDPASDVAGRLVRRISPDQMVEYALRIQADVIASSYNEPLITTEWAVDIFRKANEAGLKCAYISNGNATPEVLEYLRPHIVGYKIDLKTMQDKHYRKLGGVLDHVLDSIRLAKELGLWVEVVTLTVPDFNDSTEELYDAARFIASVSEDIPWHVTAFHPDYKMAEPQATPSKTLLRAAEIGQEAGLNYVYAGNLPGRTGEYEHTFCPNCHTPLVERYSYVIQGYNLTPDGNCPKCGTAIPGIWPDRPERVRLGGLGIPRPVRW